MPDLFFSPDKKEVEKLLYWYLANARDLPWRRDITPYRVWVSEIMLQQTRVEAVKGYFTRFVNALPDVRALASAREETLLKLWQGLGYYSRVRNMQRTAKVLCEQFGGEFPQKPEELEKLPGIGRYTAGAIASIAFGIPAPAVDGNVLRVMARLSDCDSDILLPAVRLQAEKAVAGMIPAEHAGTFTQAMIELGAIVCAPNVPPDCGRCPFAEVCRARKSGRAASLPFRSPKKERRTEKRTVLLLQEDGRYLLQRRPAQGLLAGLYEFPNFEGYLTQQEAVRAAEKLGFDPLQVVPLPACKHIFTHVEWHMQGYLLRGTLPDGALSADAAQLREDYAVPSAFSSFLKIVEERERAGY